MSDKPMRCAECWCKNGGDECEWIAPPMSDLTALVKPLVWNDFPGRGSKAQAWNEANYLIQKWSDGRWEIVASYPGYSTGIPAAKQFHPTIEQAKAAAEADHVARVLSLLDTDKLAQIIAAKDATNGA